MPIVKTAFFWVIVSLLICAPIAASEIYLRAIGLGRPILFYANASYRFAPQPHQRHRRRNGAVVTIDSKGLRSTTDWTAQADGKILFIGDSVTWGGTYIDDRDTFSEGCASAWRKRRPSGLSAETQAPISMASTTWRRVSVTGTSTTNKRSW